MIKINSVNESTKIQFEKSIKEAIDSALGNAIISFEQIHQESIDNILGLKSNQEKCDNSLEITGEVASRKPSATAIGGLTMKGNIYSGQNCPVCGIQSFVYDSKRSGLFCKGGFEKSVKVKDKKVLIEFEPHDETCATKLFKVQFGKAVNKRFKIIQEAERFLTGLRFKADEGTFDPRDYRSDNPLGFLNIVSEYLQKKKRKKISKSHWRNLNNYLTNHAGKIFGQKNIKEITYGDIEDLLEELELSEKTKSNIVSAFSDFYKWAVKRGHLKEGQVPDLPEVTFELVWRNTIDIQTQNRVLEKIKEMYDSIDPRIYLAIKLLCTYISMRPKDVTELKWGSVDLENGVIFLKRPSKTKKKKTPTMPKFVPLLQEDIELLKSLPQGLPDVHVFVHPAGISGAKPGQPYGEKYLYKKWKLACEALNIEGVDLYGGTKHSTATALNKILKISPEEIQKGAMIESNAAFSRYLKPNTERAERVFRSVSEIRARSSENDSRDKAANGSVVRLRKKPS